MQNIVRILGTARRQELLRLCWHQERSAGDLARALPDVTFGAVSQHLGKLAAAGLVTVRRDGRRRLYRARREAVGPLRAMLEAMWDDALWQLKLHAELAAERRGPASLDTDPNPPARPTKRRARNARRRETTRSRSKS